jgi:hypothetical protein
MTDNLKTWPEEIWIRERDESRLWYPAESRGILGYDDDVKYIRFDIAKEREYKLIKELYAMATLILQGDETRALVRAELNFRDGVYKTVGLEELKWANN